MTAGEHAACLSAADGGWRAACASLARQRGLTPREEEILELIVAGKANRQIESELYVSHNTLKSHLLHIHRKLGASSRADVIALVEAETSVEAAEQAGFRGTRSGQAGSQAMRSEQADQVV